LEIVEALEGPLELVECVSSSKNCEKSNRCSARMVWSELSELWRKSLSAKTLQDLLDLENAAQCFDYCI
jgi:DNA-binding IscR family transcriptional regulator